MGKKVVFDNTGDVYGSYIEYKQTGEYLFMQLKGEMFTLKLWVRRAASF